MEVDIVPRDAGDGPEFRAWEGGEWVEEQVVD